MNRESKQNKTLTRFFIVLCTHATVLDEQSREFKGIPDVRAKS